ncbi:2-amino-4-hydroxy-6-hydroxymethyldihydropteridine diphosphokinase [Gulosibacter massiliensis]|uniref:2-amino-4-hydroxy-6- hydroxymethyldihydropteridine diphosphokinase n=1 Tax=Gulosibacter massiliensis TaxID=2479839 RepID=UPI001F49C764|nr:2-amino-4-hydroxy-6-hydroxymethyldihydropteridine diphosphokinase [Gulosibacter massiliensis]
MTERDAGLGRDAQQQPAADMTRASAAAPDAREESAANAATGGATPSTPAANEPTAFATPHIHPAEAAIQLTPNRPGPAAHPALPAPELDRIVIDRLHVHGRHGVFAHERANGQDFYIDAEVWIDTRAAAASDEIEQTVHYGHLMRALYEVAMQEPVDLLETLAERLAAVTFAFPGPQAVRITVHKPQAPVKLRFDDVMISILRYRPEGAQPVEARRPSARAIIALGSNLGDREAMIRDAFEEIEDLDGVWPHLRSSLYETPALTTHGIDESAPAYLNAVIAVHTSLEPHELLDRLQQIETGHGRVRAERWGSRTLDLDIIEHGGLQLHDATLELPHPRAFERAFVLAPWTEIEPEASLPGRGPIRELLANAADRVERYRG